MTHPRRQMHLNAFLMGVGHHEAAWRHPRTEARRVFDATHFQDLARIAERGRLDAVFLADGLAVGHRVEHNVTTVFEPVTLLTAVAAATERIGLIATASTSYHHPFTLARAFASLDHISGGRAGWNIVTSGGADEAANFGLDRIPDHGERYARAHEFLEAAVRLWDSWEDDAIVLDVGSGTFADPDRVHRVEHAGPRFTIRGPLNSPRPPQGRPVLVQAGSSKDGIAFAARWAEAVFTAQQTLEEGQRFYSTLRGRLAAHGRSPDGIKILPGIVPFIADTEAEARELEQEFTELISPAHALRQLSRTLGVDLTGHPLDAPLPPLPPANEIRGNQSRFRLVADLAERESLTVRQLISRLGGGRGHRTFAGTPEQVADELQTWFTEGAADGFTIMPPYLPGGLSDFVDHVVPVLRERGLFRTDYTGRTLREHYGLDRPASVFERSDSSGIAV
ncbi:LLM class flavin-dependent oxidoreductase [Thermobifida alba]|uniref:LLM class flavin-dependent oxidoreductase n=1 Tax=Thermobifida alba TaxID=53522 RepID=A0ABY4KZP2_THEAE|nr:LLM class flavin-dependent oxidoreductase [Thermobifida alba]UPT20881.1 LLM class flavin-dependent oxidoreductase [Thermobifida alba]